MLFNVSLDICCLQAAWHRWWLCCLSYVVESGLKRMWNWTTLIFSPVESNPNWMNEIALFNTVQTSQVKLKIRKSPLLNETCMAYLTHLSMHQFLVSLLIHLFVCWHLLKSEQRPTDHPPKLLCSRRVPVARATLARIGFSGDHVTWDFDVIGGGSLVLRAKLRA